jgi:hypothetical protein
LVERLGTKKEESVKRNNEKPWWKRK